jgi:ParB/RepB/Spo0J family partition protein
MRKEPPQSVAHLSERVAHARYEKLPIEKVQPNPDQPRRFFDKEALRALADSIQQVGLLEDILVRPKGDHYEVVLGERRLRATRLAELSHIPAKVVDMTDDEMRRIAITENIQREDLTQVEEAFAFKHYVDSGARQKDVGQFFGKMQDRVAERLKLLSSHYYVQFQEQRINELEKELQELRDKAKSQPFEVQMAAENELAKYIAAGFDVAHVLSSGQIVLRRQTPVKKGNDADSAAQNSRTAGKAGR